MGRRVIAVVAAVLLSIVGVVAVVLYANGADQRAVAGAQPRTIFVSAQPVPSGTTLNDAIANGLIKETTLPAKSVPEGALTAVTDSNKDLVAVTDIAAGEYVQSARFGSTPQGNQAIRVPNGQVAVTVLLRDPARVGTFVAPGSHLVVYNSVAAGTATSQGGTQVTGVQTRVLFDDVLVIAVGSAALTPAQPTTQAPNAPNQAASSGQLVTLALSPAQAPRLVQAINVDPGLPYPIYAGLRGSDLKIESGLVVTDANLFSR